MSDQVLGIKIQLDTGDLAAQITKLQTQLSNIKMDGMSKSLSNTTLGMGKLNTAAKNVDVSLGRSGRSANAFGLTLGSLTTHLTAFYSVRNVLFAIGSQFQQAVGGALDFDQKMHDIAAIAGSSEKEMRAMGDSILQIATHSRYSAAEVGNLMEVLAQAGVAAKDLPEVSGVVGMFSTATGATPQQAAELYTTGANVWRVKAEDASRVTNVLTAALNNSKLSVQGLATAFSYLAPQAAMVGYSLETTAGMISTISQVGVKASTIGTGLSQLMKDLSAPKLRFAKLLEEKGIDLDDINPAMNSFSEIIDTFTRSGIRADEIMSKMDSRSGRSLVASLLAGSAAFKTMTESVTGTNSTILAFEKAMEGSRAKINVLKQEVLKLTVQTGGLISGTLSTALEGITNLVRGMQTVPGQLSLVITSLGIALVAVRALTAACFANPILAGVGLAIGVASGLLIAFGAHVDDTTKKAQELNKELNEKLFNAQQVADGVSKIKNEVDEYEKLNPQVAEYNKLAKSGKGDSKEANDLARQKVTLNEEQRTALYDLKGEHEDYLGNIKLEDLTYKDLLDTMKLVNAERSKAGLDAVSGYNELAEKEDQRKARLKELEKKRDESTLKWYGPYNPTGKKKWLVSDAYKNSAEIDANKKAGEDNAIEQAKLLALKPPGFYRDGKTDRIKPLPPAQQKERDAMLAIANGSDDPNKPTGAATKGADTWLQESQKRIAALEAAELSDRQAVLIKSFDDLELTYQQKSDNYTQAILLAEQESATEVAAAIAEREREWKEKQKEFGFSKTEEAAHKKELEAIRSRAAAELEKKVLGASDTFDRGTAVKTDDGLVGERTEKRQAITLQNLKRANALRKEGVWTAQEELDIELETMEAELASIEVTKSKYQADLDKLTLQKEAGTLDDKNKAYYEQLPQLIENLRLKYAETNAEKERLADTSFWGNFTQGVKQGAKELGTMQEATASLGKSMISTFAGGISNALDTMITKLREGKSGWVAFRDGMKSVMSDIGKMIQKYITDLIAMWIIQQMVGIFVGAKAAPANPNAVPMSGATTTVGSLPSTGSNTAGAFGGTKYFAEGGFIPLNLGPPGVDSVPAMLAPGEFVVPYSAVSRYGVDHFEKYRKNAFATGGLVGPRPAGADSEKEGEGDLVLNIINVADASTIPRTTGAEVINHLSFEIAKEGPVYRQLRQKIRN